jgi:hypothetical protein
LKVSIAIYLWSEFNFGISVEQASPAKIQPILLSQSVNKHIDEKMQTVLDTLLDLMVSQVLNMAQLFGIRWLISSSRFLKSSGVIDMPDSSSASPFC